MWNDVKPEDYTDMTVLRIDIAYIIYNLKCCRMYLIGSLCHSLHTIQSMSRITSVPYLNVIQTCHALPVYHIWI